MGCWSLHKGEASRQKLLKLNYSGNIEIMEIELSDIIKLQKGVDLFARKFNSLDTLINNAGVMDPPWKLTKLGLEIQFCVNHIGHMALILMLFPLLTKKSGNRVVTVTSGAQYMGKIHWSDLQGEKDYNVGLSILKAN